VDIVRFSMKDDPEFNIKFVQVILNGEGNAETENQDQAKPIKKRRYPVKDTMDVDKCFMDYLQTKTRKSSQNADEQFLLSLLPDMAEMDLRQKIMLKKSARRNTVCFRR